MNKLLTNCPLFKGLEAKEIDEIFNEIFSKVRIYNKGYIIAYQDEEVKNFMIVVEGTARGEMVDFSGKTVIIEEIVSPRSLAPAFMFGARNIYPVNIVSQTDTKILQIQKSEFIKMMQLNEKLLVNYLNNVSGRAQFLTQKLKFLSFNSIKGKLAYYILNLAKKGELKYVVLPVSQAKLAELFGVTRPSLGRALREMHNDGIIEVKAKDVKIVDKRALVELLK
ncbi:MAG: Crp/Fnr family transcriptional regulator [Marinilabiliales bacterium]|nr:MAG: Crp/Fnr family transcriptional regulator [Marinilabiliales bacterium]